MLTETGFDQLVAAAQELDPELQQALVHLIQLTPGKMTVDEAVFVDENLREAGAFEVVTPLVDAPVAADFVLEADLFAAIESMATAWEDDPLL